MLRLVVNAQPVSEIKPDKTMKALFSEVHKYHMLVIKRPLDASKQGNSNINRIGKIITQFFKLH